MLRRPSERGGFDLVRNERQRWRRNIGNKARKRLPALLETFGYKCHWCNKELVLLRAIPKSSIIDINHGLIAYRVETGEVREGLIASVDHKIGLVDGGTNEMSNLVPSCLYCNEARGRWHEQVKSVPPEAKPDYSL